MADDSDTSQPTTAFDHDESNRVSALSALYQAEQSTLSSLDSQVLVLVTLLLTYGTAAVAALAKLGDAEKAFPAAWMYVALPAPAWILLGYNAILWTKVSNHSAAAKVYRTALTKIARSEVHDGKPPQDQWNRLARTVFGLAGSRLLSYGVALALIIGFTAATVWGGRGSPCWFWSGVMVYSFALLIIGTAWLRISYAESRPNCFKRCMDWICVQRRYRPRHGARSETTIDDARVRVTTWSFEKAGDSTGAHVHEYDYGLVPVTGGTLTAVSTTDGSARTITQVAGSPYTGQAGLAHTVTADADGIVFVEVELKN